MNSKYLMVFLLLVSTAVTASKLTIDMHDLSSGKPAGYISIEQNKYGAVFTPYLSGLPEGLHGFHIHENPSCDSLEKKGKTILGGAAGSHYDPTETAHHGYPWSNNHLGDLPPIYVNPEGRAIQPVLAPRIKTSDLSGRALMMHAGGDNHADHPRALGGGGARIVCGIIK